MPELWERDAWDLSDEIRAGGLKATELLDVCLDRIARIDPVLNAVSHLDVDGARAAAEEIDRRVGDGTDPGPFAGLPFLAKETHAVEGMPYTSGSLLFADRVADHDEECIARMRAAGAVPTGLATAPEFGSLNYTRTKLHGVTGNPWNPQRTPGGSSGGSAAAVAAGLVPIASGGDGGGSIRIPSSFSGLFGFKGSQGRIPEGPTSFDGSLTTQYGAMTRSVRDAARATDVMAGPNATDPTSLPRPMTSYEAIVTMSDPTAPLRGRRAAWSSTLGYAVTDPDVDAVAHESALVLCEEAGIELVDRVIALPRVGATWGFLSSIEMVAWQGEAAAGRWDELTPAVRGGFELVENMRPEDIVRALRRRWEVIEAWAAVFGDVDLVLTPTTAVPAFAAAGPPPREIAGHDVGWTGATPFTMPANVSGTPAVSIPAGFVGGLPVGLQVNARRHEDELCFAAGAVMERARPWPKLAPDPTKM